MKLLTLTNIAGVGADDGKSLWPILYWAKCVLQRKNTERSKCYKQNYKIFLSTDCLLKLVYIKKESSVIADQNAAVNMCFNLVLTACRTLEVYVRKTS